MTAEVVRRARQMLVFAATALCLTATAAQATEVLKCASLEEGDAFRLRHLQSRLMVAALGCDQQAAYNTFVQRFKPSLASAGGRMVDYYQRTGGGQVALNAHITALANAAGLSRASDPDGYCKKAWEVFWTLEQDPLALVRIAEANLLTTEQPRSCSVTVAAQATLPPQNVTATFDATKAAAEQSNK